MDLTTRKYRFIEEFMKIINPEKIKRFEELLNEEHLEDDQIVAHTANGISVTRSQYIKNNEEAVASFKKGDFKTSSQLRDKFTSK